MANQTKEIWKQISSLKGKTTRNYAVSNHGRMTSYDNDLKDKLVLKPHLNGGYPLITVNSKGRSKAIFVHVAVAEAFLKKRNPKCDHVIHLDHNKSHNEVTNLKWVTQEEQIEHNKKNPLVREGIARKVHSGATAKKLNEKKVLQLKKELWDPNRKLTFKKLAEKYGIAEMSLYRIKSGDMWFHIHVEGEPMFTKYKEQLKNIELKNKKDAKATARKVLDLAKEKSVKALKPAQAVKEKPVTVKKSEPKKSGSKKSKDIKSKPAKKLKEVSPVPTSKKDKKEGKKKKKGDKKEKKHKKGKKK
jgi:hypothetical protein